MQYLYMGMLVLQFPQGMPDGLSTITGFYIHSCVKMRYKGDYAPSYLLDPEEYTWHPLEECRPLLDKYRYVSFAHPDQALAGPYTGSCKDISGTPLFIRG